MLTAFYLQCFRGVSVPPQIESERTWQTGADRGRSRQTDWPTVSFTNGCRQVGMRTLVWQMNHKDISGGGVVGAAAAAAAVLALIPQAFLSFCAGDRGE